MVSEIMAACDVASHPSHPYIFLFIGCSLLVAALFKSLRIRAPLTICLFLLGIVCGIMGDLSTAFQAFIDPLHSMPPSFLFYIFFPVLIFEASFNCEVAVFRLVWKEIICLAFPGMLLATSLTAGFIKLIMYRSWNWSACFLCGGILSATDPVATLGVLRDCGAGKRTRAILDGESIFNDGAAIVLYTILVPLVELGPHTGDSHAVWISQLLKCVQLVLGAVVIGSGAGYLLTQMLLRCSDKVVSASVVYASGVTVFFAAESWKVSGVLSLCFMGLQFAFNRHVVHPHNSDQLNAFWEVLVYIANVLIFTIVGIYVSNQKVKGSYYDYLMIPILYIGLLIIRFLMVFLSLGVCRLLPQRCSPFGIKDTIIIAACGLRGAVSLTLAVIIFHDSRITDAMMKRQFLLLTAGQVCLTVVLNGLLCKPLMRLLRMTHFSDEEILSLEWALDRVSSELKIKRKQLLAANIFTFPDTDIDFEIEMPHLSRLRPSKKFDGEMLSFAESEDVQRNFHHTIYNRLVHNLSMVLFEKGLISTEAVHSVTFKANQSLMERKLMTYRDFFTDDRQQNSTLTTTGFLSIFKQLMSRLRKLIFHENTALISNYRMILEILLMIMMDVSPISSIKLCGVHLYPKTFKEWILTHLTQEISCIETEPQCVHAQKNLRIIKNARKSQVNVLHKISSRTMIEIIDELIRGGLLDTTTGERLMNILRSREVQWVH